MRGEWASAPKMERLSLSLSRRFCFSTSSPSKSAMLAVLHRQVVPRSVSICNWMSSMPGPTGSVMAPKRSQPI